jgi:hypothetical protein
MLCGIGKRNLPPRHITIGLAREHNRPRGTSKSGNGRSLYQLLKFIAERLRNVSAALRNSSGNVFDGAEIHLGSLFESIRVQRNDAVDPNTASVSEDSVRMSYDAFPMALEKAEMLRRWCDARPNSL